MPITPGRKANLERVATLLAQRDAEMEANPPEVIDGSDWVQPVSVVDAYAIDAEVIHQEKTWISLVPYNVWEPGVSGWREVVIEGQIAAWVQPTGGHDAYPMGAKVTYNGQTWESTYASNVWVPGVFGWVVIP